MSISRDIFRNTDKGFSVYEDSFLHLSEFIDELSNYKQRRNYETKDHSNVSCLSPFITRRVIREKEIVNFYLQHYKFQQIQKFIEELCWKTYWRGWLEYHPEVWKDYLSDLDSMLGDTQFTDSYKDAVSGKTTISVFNDWNKELVEKGYLHNHARMWYASIWIFTLKLPWQLGAHHFLRYLLDGDEAVNTLSWRWVAGLHAKGKVYVAQRANIEKFSYRKMNIESCLAEDPDPIEDKRIYKPSEFQVCDKFNEFYCPELSESPVGLLVLPSDFSPHKGDLSEAPFSSIAVFDDEANPFSLHKSKIVIDFESKATADLIYALSNHWDAEVIEIRDDTFPIAKFKACKDNVGINCRKRLYAGSFTDWNGAVLEWAKQEKLKSVVWYQPHQGYWREPSNSLRKYLERNGIKVRVIRRKWDEVFYPHTQKGFFSLKKKIPELLDRCGICTEN